MECCQTNTIQALTGRLRPYPAYKNSRVAWLGQIPAHWVIGRLKQWTSLIQTGSTPPTSRPEYFTNGAVPWHGPSSFSTDLLLRPAARMITERAIQERVARLFDSESSMIVTIGSVGKVGFIEKQSSCNQQITTVTFDTGTVFPKYAAYELKRLEPMLAGIAPNTTLRILDQGQIGCLPFFTPPLSEQRAIATFLDRETARIDALVAKKERLIELLQEKRSALISHAVTRGLNPDVTTKDSGVEWLDEIPAHWEVKRLKYAATLGPSPTETRNFDDSLEVSFVPMETVGEHGGLELTTTKSLREVCNGYTYFREGDVLVAKITPCFENGKGAVASGLVNEIAFGTTELHVLRVKEPLHRYFLFYLSIGDAFRRLGEAEMYGTAGQKRVPESFILNLVHPLPPLPEQHAIAAYLDTETAKIDALVGRIEEAIDRLRELRMAVISAAVTGKIDVREGVP